MTCWSFSEITCVASRLELGADRLLHILVNWSPSSGSLKHMPGSAQQGIKMECYQVENVRMRFSKLVELEDVEEAARLHREALKQSATDPLTGRVRKCIYIRNGYTLLKIM